MGRGPALRRTRNKEEKANIKAAECTRGKEGEGQAMQGRGEEPGMGFGKRTLQRNRVWLEDEKGIRLTTVPVAASSHLLHLLNRSYCHATFRHLTFITVCHKTPIRLVLLSPLHRTRQKHRGHVNMPKVTKV